MHQHTSTVMDILDTICTKWSLWQSFTVTLSCPGAGEGAGEGGVSALISSIESFLDIHGIATKSVDFSPNLLENKILEKFWVKGITCQYHGVTIHVLDAMFRQIWVFLVFFSKY